jgi:hypothetical protein
MLKTLMKLKSSVSVLLAKDPKSLEQARKKYFKLCNISLGNSNYDNTYLNTEYEFDDHFGEERKGSVDKLFSGTGSMMY